MGRYLGPKVKLSRRVGVRGKLNALGPVHLLESFREQLEHGRPRLFEPLRPHLDGDSAQAQRNALFSLSKKLSSVR